jgi:hypothetical protein
VSVDAHGVLTEALRPGPTLVAGGEHPVARVDCSQRYLNAFAKLSMYPFTYHGDTKRRTLARGDIIGMRAKY